jgi:hypothetical protein
MHLKDFSSREIEDWIKQESDELEEERSGESGADLDAEKKEDEKHEQALERQHRSHPENETAGESGGDGDRAGVRVQELNEPEDLFEN